MAFIKDINRPVDRELLNMIGDGATPAEIAKSVPCSIDSVRGWLRRLGCTHNRKGLWFLPKETSKKPQRDSRLTQKRQVEVRKGVLPEQFPFIRTHITIRDDGSRITLPDLSILAVARAERDRRERCSAMAFNISHPQPQEKQNAKG
ncbi:hypothetical protein [Agrobacterium vitis]|uniref:Uncharacterized protein n=1 Tax=Agrobacterium vitis TaxID=373 RepID=A0AAE2RDB9_AGRVI|nr:hypothetical protein [Agrobacterium vitis]MBF2716286.1 hypothetical protein [Agrobacterium vitis]MVA21122.1 hypothetical protein [Agrobacterium vitis]